MNDSREFHSMVDDGTGKDIRIRSIMVHTHDGDKLIEHLQKHPQVPMLATFGWCNSFTYYA